MPASESRGQARRLSAVRLPQRATSFMSMSGTVTGPSKVSCVIENKGRVGRRSEEG